MEFQKIVNFFHATSDDKDLRRKWMLPKNGLKILIDQEEITMLPEKLQLKHAKI